MLSIVLFLQNAHGMIELTKLFKKCNLVVFMTKHNLDFQQLKSESNFRQALVRWISVSKNLVNQNMNQKFSPDKLHFPEPLLSECFLV